MTEREYLFYAYADSLIHDMAMWGIPFKPAHAELIHAEALDFVNREEMK